MKPQIKLSDRQLADLQALRDYDDVILESAIKLLQRPDAGPLTPAHLSSIVVPAFGGDSQSADTLIWQALSFRGLIRELSASPPEILAILRDAALVSKKPWSAEEIDRWDRKKGLLSELLSLDVIAGTAKALEIAYEHSYLLQKARIFTDVRPVFSDDAAAVQGVWFPTRLECGTRISGRNILSNSPSTKGTSGRS